MGERYVYHRRAPGFRGETIYPLHALAERFPDLYDAQRAKYAGREALMDNIVPLLGRRWNDVVHCAPIHPHRVYRALAEAGDAPQLGERRQFFRIPVGRLAGVRAVWFTYPADERPAFPIGADQVAWFDPTRYEELTAVPPRTCAYYRAELAAGRPPLLYRHVPHVLVDGPIDVADVDIIEWHQPI